MRIVGFIQYLHLQVVWKLDMCDDQLRTEYYYKHSRRQVKIIFYNFVWSEVLLFERVGKASVEIRF